MKLPGKVWLEKRKRDWGGFLAFPKRPTTDLGSELFVSEAHYREAVEALKTARMFTGAIMSSPFWDADSKRAAQPAHGELCAALVRADALLENDDAR